MRWLFSAMFAASLLVAGAGLRSPEAHERHQEKLCPSDMGFVDERNGWGWSERCFEHLKAERFTCAIAACDRGYDAARGAESEPSAHRELSYHFGLVFEAQGNYVHAVSDFSSALKRFDGPVPTSDVIKAKLIAACKAAPTQEVVFNCIDYVPHLCSLSSSCKENGACSFVDDDSLMEVEDSNACPIALGKWSHCQPQSNADCSNSRGCKTSGACSVSSDPFICRHPNPEYHKRRKKCLRTNQEKCAGLDECVRESCHTIPRHFQDELVIAVCCPASNLDCRKSDECTLNGKCTFRPENPEERARARLSQHEFGKCGTFCVVAANTDCTQSQACTKEGRCIARDGECVRN